MNCILFKHITINCILPKRTRMDYSLPKHCNELFLHKYLEYPFAKTFLK